MCSILRKQCHNKLMLTLFFAIIFANCAFTQSSSDVSMIRLKKDDFDMLEVKHLMSKIDFYISHDITLYRELRDDEITATNGILKTINDVRYEYIVFPKHNVGHFRSTSGYNSVRVSFDAKHPEKTFRFELVYAPRGEQYFYLSTFIKDNLVTVNYGGIYYYMKEEPGFNKEAMTSVFLLYDKNNTSEKIIMNVDTLKSFHTR
jgi:hypothetical protein